MGNQNSHSLSVADALDLRQHAEARYHCLCEVGHAAFTSQFSSKDTKWLLHELQVHQIELELQNEELLRSNEELLKLNEELENSRDRYTDLYDLAPVGYCTLDEDWLILEANLTAATLFGIPRDRLHGQFLTKFINFDDQDIFHHMRNRFLHGDAAQFCELRMRKNDGTLFWVQFEVNRVISVKNETTLHLILSNITARKNAEASSNAILALEQNAAFILLHDLEQQKRVIDLHAIVTITDCEGRITYCNDKFTEISGYIPDEFLGQTHDIVHSGHHPNGFFKAMIDTIRQGKEWRATVCNRAKDGHLFWVDTTVLAHIGKDGVPIRYIAVRTDVTRQKQIEDNLRKSEERFRHFFDKNSLVQLLINPRSHVIENANQAAIAYYGYPKNKLIGMAIRNINMLSQQRVDEDMQLAFQEKKNYFLFQHRLASGEIRDVEVHSTPIESEGCTLLFSIIHDITERKKAQDLLMAKEQALRLSEAQMNASQKIGGTGSWVYDIETNTLRPSAQSLAVFGYPPEDKDYSLDECLTCIPERERVRQTLADAIDNASEYDDEYAVIPIDGSPSRIVHVIGSMEKDAQGKVQKVIGFMQDITQRRSTEAKLLKLLLDQDAILQSKAVGFFIVHQCVIHWVNDTAAKMLGYECHELANQGARIFYQNDAAYEAFCRDACSEINAERAFHGQYQLIHKDGSLKWLNISVARLPSDHEATIWAFVDISPLKFTEAELRDANIAAEAANVAKSRFLATMSHEIRTPMNGILGMAQLLLMPNLTENERHEYAKTICTSGQILLALLNDILDLSKIESGKFQLDSVVFEPDSLLRETHMLFSGTANTKGLQFEYQWKGFHDSLYLSDATRIRQMLSNIVGNSIKFTKEGCVRIEGVEIEREGESALLEFSVSDTGIGIPPDKIDLLFKPFSQADNSITREFCGSGLGLSIVSHLAKMMGGDVGVESVAGKGSRFWFRLLAKLVAIDEKISSQKHLAPSNTMTESALLSGRVLVVEDNAVNCAVIDSLLTKLGVSVTLTYNGQQALDIITQGDCHDLVLMDLHMPIMDGYTATEQIRQWELHDNRPRIPIVALTADAYEEDRQHCLAIGMNDFLTKPIALDALQSALYKWLPMPNSDSESHLSGMELPIVHK
jgi:PAS domain S-box-containing protein